MPRRPVPALAACALAAGAFAVTAAVATGQQAPTTPADPQTLVTTPTTPTTPDPTAPTDTTTATATTTPPPAATPPAAPDPTAELPPLDAAPPTPLPSAPDPADLPPLDPVPVTGEPESDASSTSTMSTLDLIDPPIGLSVPATLYVGALALGQQAAVTGSVTVTALNDWTLQVAAGAGGDGHLMPDNCEAGATPPANRLWVEAQRNLLSAPASVTGVSLSGSAQQIAGGTGTMTFPVTVSQSIGAAERLAAGCSYRATVVYTLVGS